MGNPTWQAVLFGLAGLFLLFEVWRGWRAGLVRSGLMLAAMVVSTIVAYFAMLAAAAPFGGIKEVAGCVAGLVIGGGIGLIVFLVIWLAGAVLFKRTEHQGSGIFRLIWGVGGAFFGFCTGLVILWCSISVVRSLGALAESTIVPPKHSSVGGAKPAPTPALVGGLVTLKDSLELGPAGKVVQSVDVLPPDFYVLIGQMGKLSSDPEVAARFVSYPQIQKIAENPKMIELANDPSVIKAVQSQNFMGLMSNAAVLRAIQDPAFVKEIKQIDIRAALKFALEKPTPTPSPSPHQPKPKKK